MEKMHALFNPIVHLAPAFPWRELIDVGTIDTWGFELPHVRAAAEVIRKAARLRPTYGDRMSMPVRKLNLIYVRDEEQIMHLGVHQPWSVQQEWQQEDYLIWPALVDEKLVLHEETREIKGETTVVKRDLEYWATPPASSSFKMTRKDLEAYQVLTAWAGDFFDFLDEYADTAILAHKLGRKFNRKPWAILHSLQPLLPKMFPDHLPEYKKDQTGEFALKTEFDKWHRPIAARIIDRVVHSLDRKAVRTALDTARAGVMTDGPPSRLLCTHWHVIKH